jgi:hypothetical protein
MGGREPKRTRRKWQVFVWWSLFAAGLIVQLLAPHLKVSNGAFVIPQKMIVSGKMISPEKIVRKDRLMQLLSAVLTASGALGLAFCYRDVLFKRASREVAEAPGQPDYAISDGPRHRTSTTGESEKKHKELSL